MPQPAGGTAAPARARGGVWGWGLLVLLLLAEALLFRLHAQREIAFAYPAMWDQVAIYSRAYLAYDRTLQMGLVDGLGPLLARPSATGAVAPAAVALLMRLLGPSRVSALALNFLWFALAQVLLVLALRRVSRSWSAPALGLGLWLAAGTFFCWGGLFDLRLDFGAACLFGGFVSLVVASDTLRSARRGAGRAPGRAAGAVPPPHPGLPAGPPGRLRRGPPGAA